MIITFGHGIGAHIVVGFAEGVTSEVWHEVVTRPHLGELRVVRGLFFLNWEEFGPRRVIIQVCRVEGGVMGYCVKFILQGDETMVVGDDLLMQNDIFWPIYNVKI